MIAQDAGGLDETAWQQQLQIIVADSNSACGLSYDVYEAKLSASVDSAISRLPAVQQSRAIELALPLGYQTPAQLAETLRGNYSDGSCSHGIDPNCCPAGCGDLEDAPWNRDE